VAGDIARWHNELFDEEMRVEHWTNAAEQGAAAATNLLAAAAGGAGEAYAPVPFFWSDQLSHRLQFVGHVAADDDVVVVAGAVGEGKWLALYGRAGRLRGALGVNAPRWVLPMRQMLLDRAGVEEAATAARARASG
jgi:NADPH-dependent 2,4-dienoyl-CoA reductase/sulfur reductase-like enzyme